MPCCGLLSRPLCVLAGARMQSHTEGVVLANQMLERQTARRGVRPASHEAARWSAIPLGVPAPAQLLAVCRLSGEELCMHAQHLCWHCSATVLELEARHSGAP